MLECRYRLSLRGHLFAIVVPKQIRTSWAVAARDSGASAYTDRQQAAGSRRVDETQSMGQRCHAGARRLVERRPHPPTDASPLRTYNEGSRRDGSARSPSANGSCCDGKVAPADRDSDWRQRVDPASGGFPEHRSTDRGGSNASCRGLSETGRLLLVWKIACRRTGSLLSQLDATVVNVSLRAWLRSCTQFLHHSVGNKAATCSRLL